MEPSYLFIYLFIYKHSIHELFRIKENDSCHIACVKRYLYNNNLFPANLEQLIIMTEPYRLLKQQLDQLGIRPSGMELDSPGHWESV